MAMQELANTAKTGVSVFSDAEKLGIIGILLMLVVVVAIFGWAMWREERKCRKTMFYEIEKCRDEIKDLLKADVTHARTRQS